VVAYSTVDIYPGIYCSGDQWSLLKPERNVILISSSNLTQSLGEIESDPAEIEKIPGGG
jgi:hypothetical protein